MYIPDTPRFMNPSPPFQAALSSIPGYDSHVLALAALAPVMAAARKAQNEAQTALDGLGASLAETLTRDPDKAARAIADHAAKADQAADDANHAAARVTFLTDTERKLGTELDSIITGCASRVLKHLDGTLKDAYRESWDLGLEGVRDAESAIEAGLAKQWGEMLRLRGTIFAIRAAQATIIGRLGSLENVQRLGTFGALANYAAADPAFLKRRTSSRWGRENLNAPWPMMSDNNPDPVSLHGWILDHPDFARPWVPTERELVAAVQDAEQAARAAIREEEAAA